MDDGWGSSSLADRDDGWGTPWERWSDGWGTPSAKKAKKVGWGDVPPPRPPPWSELFESESRRMMLEARGIWRNERPAARRLLELCAEKVFRSVLLPAHWCLLTHWCMFLTGAGRSLKMFMDPTDEYILFLQTTAPVKNGACGCARPWRSYKRSKTAILSSGMALR